MCGILTRLDGVSTLGGLAGQHDTVSAVDDGVGDVADLGTSGTRVVLPQIVSNILCSTYRRAYRHGLEHLGGDNNGLASLVALGNHHLLRKEDLAGGNFDTEVTTGDHDTVGLCEDLIEVRDTLFILDFDDDFDVRAVRAEDATDVAHIIRAADERREDHVDAVLDTELEVGLVLLGKSGEIDIGFGKVDTLARGEGAVVESANAHVLALDAKHEQGQNTYARSN